MAHKKEHPLYHSWAWMKRMSAKFEMAPEWKSNFNAFVEDMGIRPSPQHRLYRKDETKGYFKENCYWDVTIPSTDSAAYQREWRKQNPEKARNHNLRKMFNISTEEFNILLKKQVGVCAICKQEERLDRYSYLSVDHCHETGKIRGLLCSSCNRGLGLFQDKISSLENAISYLKM